MALPAFKNFAKVEVSTGYDASATSIVLATDEGAKLPAPATDGNFYLVWWNFTDYKDPADDPNVEKVLCTAKSGDTLTLTRGQRGTTAQNHNISGKVYKMAIVLDSQDLDEVDYIFMETPSGAINGSNTSFTTAYQITTGKIMLMLNGVMLIENTHYTISGKTITMTTAPLTGEVLTVAFYKRASKV